MSSSIPHTYRRTPPWASLASSKPHGAAPSHGRGRARAAVALALIVAFASLAACSTDRDPESLFSPTQVNILVVDGALIVDQAFPEIFLSRTLSPLEPFTPENAAENNATVIVSGGGVDIPYVQAPATDFPGKYEPSNSGAARVSPNTTYQLTVTTENGEELTASTTTPERLHIDEWVLLDDSGTNIVKRLKTFEDFGNPDDIYRDPANQLTFSQGLLEARLLRGLEPAYQVAFFNLEEDPQFVIDTGFLEEEDLEEFEQQVSSPALEAEDGKLRAPWFAIFFAGKYKIRINRLDTNWFDLIRSLPDGNPFGFGGAIGDNFEQPIFHIQGGIGLFGSAAVDSIGVNILPPPAP